MAALPALIKIDLRFIQHTLVQLLGRCTAACILLSRALNTPFRQRRSMHATLNAHIHAQPYPHPTAYITLQLLLRIQGITSPSQTPAERLSRLLLLAVLDASIYYLRNLLPYLCCHGLLERR